LRTWSSLEQIACTPSTFRELNEQRLLGGFGKKSQSRKDDSSLKRGIVRLPQWISQRTIHKHCPRGLQTFGDLSQERDGDSRNSRLLDDALYQPHGLVAHRSNRRQQHRIDEISSNLLRNLRRGALHETPRRGDGTHQTEVALCHRTDQPFLF